MKKIAKNKWTDGEHMYEGNPKDGFTKIGNGDLKDEIVTRMKDHTVDSGQIVAQPVKMDELPVDTQDKE